jgi:phage tail sheath protein FI
MPTYQAPGVYIEEIPSAPVILPVGTSTAAFIGAAPKADAFPATARAVNSWTQFVRDYLPEKDAASTPLSHAVYGFFLNGGSRCYVVNIPTGKPIAGTGKERGALQMLETVEAEIVAAPGMTDAVTYDALLTHCENMKDRVAILDADPAAVDNIDSLKTIGRAKPADGGDKKATALRPRASTYGTVYFPQILVRDPLSSDPKLVPVFPSGHMAGIWARSDAARGVHKAPANEVVRGAIDLTYSLTPAEQGGLNDSGVNCLRFFEREGLRVWGARTLAEPGSEFRYLNVRRLFNFIEQSIAQSTKWVVFEDNAIPLWRNLTRDVTAFLINVWRDNALVGATPQQAFFVACNAATNPPESVDLGQVIVLIGLAPVKPAEFVVFRLSQKLGNVPEIQAVG